VFASILLFTLLWGLAFAQAGAQAFGTIGKGGNTGMKATVWTAQQPNFQNNWVASPVGVCTTTPPCTGIFVETGYIKGDGIPGLTSNVLQQYSSWGYPGFGVAKWDLGNLNDNALYTFTVLSKPSISRWVIKRDGVRVWHWDYADLGFSAGRMVFCGAEAQVNGTTIAVQCSQMQYYYQGAWTLFNYTYAQTSPGYCVFKPFEFGATGWGPC